jgi:hemoglobin-like flavoprotein
MSTSEISDKNVVMASFDDVPEEVHKAVEELKKALEKEMQELLACYEKDRRSSIMQIRELILSLINYAKEVHTAKVSHPSISVTPDDVSIMSSEHVKLTRNMVGDEVAKGLTKFLQDSK